MAEIGLEALTRDLSGGRDGAFVGPEVTVPGSGSAQGRLLGLSGRTP